MRPGGGRYRRTEARPGGRRVVRAAFVIAPLALAGSVLTAVDALPWAWPGAGVPEVIAVTEPRPTFEVNAEPLPLPTVSPTSPPPSISTPLSAPAPEETAPEETAPEEIEPDVPPTPVPDAKPPASAPLPERSGAGKRVVFALAEQQVWLVAADDTVERTYKVSGSKYGQLKPDSYEVFSASRHTTSWTGKETMEYMVRFHRGERANIGFHDIPVNTSTEAEVQTLSELGTPLSDGCIRQDNADAKALWDFAPVGTAVVVIP